MPEKKYIDRLVCKLDVESGDIICKVDKARFEKIKQSKPPKRIIFELKK